MKRLAGGVGSEEQEREYPRQQESSGQKPPRWCCHPRPTSTKHHGAAKRLTLAQPTRTHKPFMAGCSARQQGHRKTDPETTIEEAGRGVPFVIVGDKHHQAAQAGRSCHTTGWQLPAQLRKVKRFFLQSDLELGHDGGIKVKGKCFAEGEDLGEDVVALMEIRSRVMVDRTKSWARADLEGH